MELRFVTTVHVLKAKSQKQCSVLYPEMIMCSDIILLSPTERKMEACMYHQV